MLDVESYNEFGLIRENNFLYKLISNGYLKDKNSEWYEMPNNVVGVLTDPVTGELATNDSKRKKIM